MPQVDVRTSSYFPFAFRLGAVLLGIIAIATVVVSPVTAIILAVISLICVTTHYRLEVDLQKKKYRESVWFLGLRTGEWEAMQGIDYLFITPVKMSQRLNSRISSSTLHTRQYAAYLRFSETQKIHLFTGEKKDSVLQRLKPIGRDLNTRVIDYTESSSVQS